MMIENFETFEQDDDDNFVVVSLNMRQINQSTTYQIEQDVIGMFSRFFLTSLSSSSVKKCDE